MGWNEGYEILEKQVVQAYNLNTLTPDLLTAIASPFMGKDVDSGGSNNLLSNDGLPFEAIVVKTYKPNEYKDAMDNPIWYNGEEPSTTLHNKFTSNRKLSELFDDIWRKDWEMW
jgi:hypothetical protein